MKFTKIKRYTIPAFALYALICITSLPLYSQKILSLNDSPESYNLGLYLYYLEDKKNSITIKEASSKDTERLYTLSKWNSINFGFTNSPYWLKLIVKNGSKSNADWILEIDYKSLDRAELYSPDGHGGFTKQVQGQIYPFSIRSIKHHNPLFELNIKTNETKIYFMKAKGEPLKLPIHIYPAKIFYRVDHDVQFALGIYYGIIAVMIFFNLILFFFLKDKNYIFLVLFIISWILNQMCLNGIAYEYLWPEAVKFNLFAEMFFTGFVDLTGLVFATHFFSLRERFPKIYMVYLAFMALSVLQIINAPCILYAWKNILRIQIHNIIILGVVLLAIISSLIIYVNKYREARFFLLAWTAFLIGTVINVLSNFAIFETVINRSSGFLSLRGILFYRRIFSHRSPRRSCN